MATVEYEFRSEEKRSTLAMTDDEKRQMSVDVHKLSCDQLTHMESIAKQREERSEIEMSYDALRPTTVRELDAYMNACIAQNVSSCLQEKAEQVLVLVAKKARPYRLLT